MNKARTDRPREGKPKPHNQKRSPDRMRRFLECLAEAPNVRRAAKLAGVSRGLPRYWKEQSRRGPEGGDFAVEMDLGDGVLVTKEFHEWWPYCLDDGVDVIEEIYQEHATGYWEPVIYEGRLQYELDPKKPFTYSKDGKPVPNYRRENGELVVLKVFKRSESAAHNHMKAHRPSVYRENFKVDASVNHTGGAFFVPAKALNTAEFVAETDEMNREAVREAREREKRGGEL